MLPQNSAQAPCEQACAPFLETERSPGAESSRGGPDRSQLTQQLTADTRVSTTDLRETSQLHSFQIVKAHTCGLNRWLLF